MGEEEMKEIASVKAVVDEIKEHLVGTFKNKGMITKVEEHASWINYQKKKQYGIINTVYKVSITVLITYVAVKVGLK